METHCENDRRSNWRPAKPACAALFLIAFLSIQSSCSKEDDPSDKSGNFLPIIDRAYNRSSWPLTYSGAELDYFSSYDRTGGNFRDGFTGEYSRLYEEAEGSVLADVSGAGMLNHLWVTHIISGLTPKGDYLIYLDDDSSPTIRISSADLFGEGDFLFEFPVVGASDQSSGGFYSFAPIFFRKRLKVVYTGDSRFYHIGVERFPQGSLALSGLSPEADRIKETFTTSPEGGPSISEGEKTISGWEIKLPPGPGMVEVIELTAPGIGPEQLQQMELSADWDDIADAIKVPADLAFAAVSAPTDYTSLLTRVDSTSGVYRLHIPAPYRKTGAVHFRLRAGAEGDLPAAVKSVRAFSTAQPVPANAAYLRTAYKEETPTAGRDFVVADLPRGCGHIVGFVLACFNDGSIGSTLNRAYLEGDARVYLNGGRSPRLHDTGTEDIFNGAWYFLNDTFALPTHGNPIHLHDENDLTVMYRWFMPDVISYQNGFRFGIEHGGFNEFTIPYRGLIYYYGLDRSAAEATDEINFGNADSIAAHNVVFNGEQDEIELSGKFVGDAGSESITRSGIAVSGSTEFDIAAGADNRGLVLRLLTDAMDGFALAVSVDGKDVGLWRNEATNEYYRWFDHEYVIGEKLTGGKKKVRIKLARTDERAQKLFGLEAFNLQPCAIR